MEQSWHYLMYYACICLERLRKSQNTVVRIIIVSSEMQTGHILRTCQKRQLTVFGAGEL